MRDSTEQRHTARVHRASAACGPAMSAIVAHDPSASFCGAPMMGGHMMAGPEMKIHSPVSERLISDPGHVFTIDYALVPPLPPRKL